MTAEAASTSVSIPYRLATNGTTARAPKLNTFVSIPYRLATNPPIFFIFTPQVFSFNPL